jgi:hypothetical protein
MALTFDSTTSVLLVDTTLGPKTIQLPQIAARPGRVITIKDTGSASAINTITIQPNPSDTVEIAPLTIQTPLGFYTLIANSS